MNKDQQKLKKSLLDAIKRADFETIENLACAIDWGQFYTQGSSSIPTHSEEMQGILFDLFPMGIEATDEPYYDWFSKKCLRLFMKHGYDPSRDLDICVDFFTECHRQCFKDFCDEIKNQPDVLKKIFLSFLEGSLPWYEEHFEYLIHPCLGKINGDGRGAMDRMWGNLVEELMKNDHFVLNDFFVDDSYIKTSQALEKHCLKTPEQKKSLVQTIRKQQKHFHIFRRLNCASFPHLEDYLNDLVTRTEKSLLNDGLCDNLSKAQLRDFSRKM